MKRMLARQMVAAGIAAALLVAVLFLPVPPAVQDTRQPAAPPVLADPAPAPQESPAASVAAGPAPRDEEGLWSALERALRSGQAGALYAGLQEARECTGVQREQAELQNFVALAPTRLAQTGDLEARRAAAQRLLAACMDFITRGVPQGQQMVERLRAAGQATGMAIFQAPDDPQALGDMAALLLGSGQPAQQALGLQVLERSVLPHLPEDEALVFLAATRTLACQLGRDCSALGLDMSLLCALGGVCDTDTATFFSAGMTPQQREQLAQRQGQITQVMQGRLTVPDLLR